MSSVAHLSTAHLEPRKMTEAIPKTESKLCWLSKKLTEPRYVVNLPDATENRKRSILGVEKENGEVKENKRYVLGVVAPGDG